MSDIVLSDKLIVADNGMAICAVREGDGRIVLYTKAIALEYDDLQRGIKEYLNCFKEYNEDEHPRDEDGQWTDAGGGDGGGSEETGGGGSSGGDLNDKEKEDLKFIGSAETARGGYAAGAKEKFDKLRSSKSFGKTLDKLPHVTRTVYRGMVLKTQKEIDQFQVNKEIAISKHSFATPNRALANSYAGLQMMTVKGTPIVFSIKDAKVVDYGQSDFAAVKNKLEVILKMGARIKITSVRKTEWNGKPGYNVAAEYVK